MSERKRPDPAGSVWKRYDEQRARPRLTLTVSSEARDLLDQLAAAHDGVSISSLVEAWAMAEARKLGLKPR